MGWDSVRGADTFIHVIPHGDSYPHVPSASCICRPQRDDVERRVYVHNSADGRERFEDLPVT